MGDKLSRLFAAITFAPMIGGLVTGAAWQFVSSNILGSPPLGNHDFTSSWMWMMGGYFAILAFVVTVLVGLPAHFILKSIGRHGILDYVAAALAVGTAIGVLVAFAGAYWPTTVSMGAITGALTASLAWIIRRPDLDKPVSHSSQT